MWNIEYDKMYKEQIDTSRLPQHVAIIMDGNGRWAQQRGKVRTEGHSAGADNVHDIITAAAELHLGFVTLYTFSTENWNRPKDEVSALMNLLMKHLDGDLFMKNGVRFRIIGDRKRLPLFVREGVEALEELTKDNQGTCLVLALSYSSKWELTEAIHQIASEVASGTLSADVIDEDVVSRHLQTSFMPDPELLIRTGGEQRISNYLLWQCAYSEFYFTDVYWPDFNREELYKAIVAYQHRQRRFGKTGEQIESEKKE